MSAHFDVDPNLTHAATVIRPVDAPRAYHRPTAEQGAHISHEPPKYAGTSPLVACLEERAPGDQLALKDRALDVAAEGVTIADARLPDRPLIYVNEGFELSLIHI